MKFIPVALSLILIIVGAFASRQYQKKTMEVASGEVLSQKDLLTSTHVPTQIPSPTNAFQVSSTPAPTNSTAGNLVDIGQFSYPESKLLSSSANSLILESSDNTDKISDWYKAKIESLGVNIKTFVNTKANDKVLNKLVGANANYEIRVEVNKDSAGSNAKITVTLNYSSD